MKKKIKFLFSYFFRAPQRNVEIKIKLIFILKNFVKYIERERLKGTSYYSIFKRACAVGSPSMMQYMKGGCHDIP